MARTSRVKKTGSGTSYYHLMSRANDRRFLFEKGRVKTRLVDALRRAAEFSGIELEAYTAMGNHFHVVCKVVRDDEPVPEGELIRRVGVLKGAVWWGLSPRCGQRHLRHQVRSNDDDPRRRR